MRFTHLPTLTKPLYSLAVGKDFKLCPNIPLFYQFIYFLSAQLSALENFDLGLGKKKPNQQNKHQHITMSR